MIGGINIKSSLRFVALIVVTIILTYGTNEIISSAFYAIILVIYYRSKGQESFWLAYFFTIADGFAGFLGSFSAFIALVPGLPAIEITQFYIILSLIKAWKNKSKPYYRKWTIALFVYVLLLVVVGLMNGLQGEMNMYFRVVKLIVPLFLFFTVPRLLNSIDEYKKLFSFLFVVSIVGFITQLFTVFTGYSPLGGLKVIEEDQGEAGNLRAFYNVAITFISLFGAIFFLSIKDQDYFKKWLLYLVLGCAFSMAFLSATRGWIIGTGIVITLFVLIIQKGKNIVRIALVFFLLGIIGMGNKKIREQAFYSLDRFMTLEALAGGDETANGTLARLNERGPVVMAAWAENPILGWGFSNMFFEKNDGHVGNQNILMHAGVVGFSLLMMFFIFVNATMISVHKSFTDKNKYKETGLVFVVFFIGYFIVHSSSGQQFGLLGWPGNIFPQAVFLALSSVVYNLSKEKGIVRKGTNTQLNFSS